MTRGLLLCAAILAAFAAGAGERVKIWPEGMMPDAQPHQVGAMMDEAQAPGFVADEHRVPYLEWFIPSNLTTRAVQIIYSGGAYNGNGPNGFEVAPARRFLNEKGMAVVTMKYRTPRPVAPLAKPIILGYRRDRQDPLQCAVGRWNLPGLLAHGRRRGGQRDWRQR